MGGGLKSCCRTEGEILAKNRTKYAKMVLVGRPGPSTGVCSLNLVACWKREVLVWWSIQRFHRYKQSCDQDGNEFGELPSTNVVSGQNKQMHMLRPKLRAHADKSALNNHDNAQSLSYQIDGINEDLRVCRLRYATLNEPVSAKKTNISDRNLQYAILYYKQRCKKSFQKSYFR
jgi:hypothetical protein